MKATITLSVDVPSVQKLTALRDQLAGQAEADEDVTLIASASAPDEEQFTVLGSYKGSPGEVYREVVRATDREAAAETALKVDAKRTVVGVLAGDVEVG